MKVFSLLLLAASSSASLLRSTDLESLDFSKFVSTFGLKYSASELEMRKALFAAEHARVVKHNANKKSWTETINRFSAMTVAEKRASMGHHKGAKQSFVGGPSKQTLPPTAALAASNLPKNVDWREAGIVSAVKDQGHCGSCWAFASTATIESAVAKASGLLFDLSVQQIAMCAPNPQACGGTGNCAGATAEVAFDYVAQGACWGWGWAASVFCFLPSHLLSFSPRSFLSSYSHVVRELASCCSSPPALSPIPCTPPPMQWAAF